MQRGVDNATRDGDVDLRRVDVCFLHERVHGFALLLNSLSKYVSVPQTKLRIVVVRTYLGSSRDVRRRVEDLFRDRNCVRGGACDVERQRRRR